MPSDETVYCSLCLLVDIACIELQDIRSGKAHQLEHLNQDRQ